jgi:hypothetical protein
MLAESSFAPSRLESQSNFLRQVANGVEQEIAQQWFEIRPIFEGDYQSIMAASSDLY